MEQLNCIINQSLKRDLPEFDFKLIFENEWFRDEYNLETEKEIPKYRIIKYNIKKNDEFIGSVLMENYNFNEFMNKFMDIIDDYDLKKLYEKNIKQTLSENYKNFIDSFEMNLVKRPNNLIGEVYRMRKISGLV